MAKCVVIKGGWSWKGEVMEKGQVIEESPEWIANRVNDVSPKHPQGLVAPVADSYEPETATAPDAPETAEAPRARRR